MNIMDSWFTFQKKKLLAVFSLLEQLVEFVLLFLLICSLDDYQRLLMESSNNACWQFSSSLSNGLSPYAVTQSCSLIAASPILAIMIMTMIISRWWPADNDNFFTFQKASWQASCWEGQAVQQRRQPPHVSEQMLMLYWCNSSQIDTFNSCVRILLYKEGMFSSSKGIL